VNQAHAHFTCFLHDRISSSQAVVKTLEDGVHFANEELKATKANEKRIQEERQSVVLALKQEQV
jgi:hypothetical protein